MLNWIEGRQGTSYLNCKLLESKKWFFFDLYLIKFPVGSHIPLHRDGVDFGKHYRANFILWPAKLGGKFSCEKCIIDLPFVKFFRPDLYEHEVTEIKQGTRYVLSFGFIQE